MTYRSTDAAGNDRVLDFSGRHDLGEADRLRRPEGRAMLVLIRKAEGAVDPAGACSAVLAGSAAAKR